MERLRSVLAQLLTSVLDRLTGGAGSGMGVDRPDRDADELGTDHEGRAGVRERGGFREVQRHRAGGEVSSAPGSPAWSEEQIAWMDGRVQTVVRERTIHRCGCGALAGYQTNLLGFCSVCGRAVCSGEGCAARCERCGRLTCMGHSVRVQGHTFCSHHRLLAYGLRFWDLLR